MQALLQFVARKVQNQQLDKRGAGGVNISLEVLVIMMRTLQSNVMGLPPESGGELAHLKHTVVGLHPELQVRLHSSQLILTIHWCCPSIAHPYWAREG